MRVPTRSSATGPAAVGLDELVVDGGLFVGVGRFAPRTRGQPLAPGLRSKGASYCIASFTHRLVRLRLVGNALSML